MLVAGQAVARVGSRLAPLFEVVGAQVRELWERMGRDVAVKVVAEQFIERFDREVRAIAALNHPNICTIHDVGPNYLVMEYVNGVPLRGPLSEAATLEFAAQFDAQLAAAAEDDNFLVHSFCSIAD